MAKKFSITGIHSIVKITTLALLGVIALAKREKTSTEDINGTSDNKTRERTCLP
jgi:hypothetical protein